MENDEELPEIPKCISCDSEIDNPDKVNHTSDNEVVCDECV